MKKMFFFSLIVLVSLTGCLKQEKFSEDGIYAVFDTNKGDFACRLFYKDTPVTVGNFIGLAEGSKEYTVSNESGISKKPFYNGLIFHRVIDGFMIQGGDPLGNGRGGPGYSFIDEFVNSLKHDKAGILSMANSGPATNGSQFFITLAPTPHLNGRHTVFGEVVTGMKTVYGIGKTKVARGDKPVSPVKINKLSIVRIGVDAEVFDAAAAFDSQKEKLEKEVAGRKVEMETFLSSIDVNIDDVVTTDSGLQYVINKKGSGISPKKGENIVAHYTGYLTNGTKFDSSVDRNQPFKTAIGVGRVIKGWDEAFLDMKVGEKRVLIIPYQLAYGASGRPPTIPPKATLIFVVELLEVNSN